VRRRWWYVAELRRDSRLYGWSWLPEFVRATRATEQTTTDCRSNRLEVIASLFIQFGLFNLCAEGVPGYNRCQ
jgi:hypothetical protein